MASRSENLRSRRQFALQAAAALALPALSLRAGAQPAWPTKALKLVVPFAPGGGTDALARTIADKLTPALGQAVVVENRPGAGGSTGAEIVVASSDQHTFLFTTASIAVNPSLYDNLRFDVNKDLQPIGHVTSSPLVLVVSPKVAAGSVEDLVKLAGTRKGGLNFASPGIGTTSHLGGVLFTQLAKFPATHVSYRGAGPALNALLAGEVEFSLMAAVAAIPLVKRGQLKAIGIAGRRPLPDLQNLPLLTTQFPSLELDNWQAIFAPKSLPPVIAAQFSGKVREVLKNQEVRTRIYADGAAPVGDGPQELRALVQKDMQRYGQIIRSASIKPE